MDRQNSEDLTRFLEGMASSDDVLFGFLDDGNQSPENFGNSCKSGEGDYDIDDDDGGDSDISCSSEGNKAFWQEQEELLQATLYRTSSVETKIRKATKEALKEVNSIGEQCVCRKPVAGGCRSCLRREISVRLQNAGFNCLICKSKWRSSKDIPAGEHEYLEVIEKLGSKKGEIRVVIELAFRSEFEMARASEEYRRLISRLPEVYVGKTERLKSLIKILCTAAKKCMKEKKMHMGPWRKQKYMQAKWLGTCKRTAVSVPSEPSPAPEDRLPVKPRVSMLNLGLLDGMPGMGRCAAVAVV